MHRTLSCAFMMIIISVCVISIDMPNALDTIQDWMNVMDDALLVVNAFMVTWMIEEILFVYVLDVIMEVFVNITLNCSVSPWKHC